MLQWKLLKVGKKKRVNDTLITPTNAMILYYVIIDYRQLVTKNDNCKELYETAIKQLDTILHSKTVDDLDDATNKHLAFSDLVNMLVWRRPY